MHIQLKNCKIYGDVNGFEGPTCAMHLPPSKVFKNAAAHVQTPCSDHVIRAIIMAVMNKVLDSNGKEKYWKSQKLHDFVFSTVKIKSICKYASYIMFWPK